MNRIEIVIIVNIFSRKKKFQKQKTVLYLNIASKLYES